ncbi:MAG: RdgB/HAM1 family non-canonical purine NTP pyrophosphatase [Lachnospiraceae bacterium]|nr:RdgB/HAM1 family non-canonical purine NTP pyrophosphatase [Lachnospiraceae bacterium]
MDSADKEIKKVVFATGNADKLREIREILSDLPVEVVSMKEAGFTGDIDENGETFADNAMIKAKTVCGALGCITLADDSGLVIDALDGRPGVHSARFMGHETPYDKKNAAILSMLSDVPEEKRTARYVCAIAAAFPDGRTYLAEETMEGKIGHEARGRNGFGFDPVFVAGEDGRTAAELTDEEKNRISHRGKAMRKMESLIKEALA